MDAGLNMVPPLGLLAFLICHKYSVHAVDNFVDYDCVEVVQDFSDKT